MARSSRFTLGLLVALAVLVTAGFWARDQLPALFQAPSSERLAQGLLSTGRLAALMAVCGLLLQLMLIGRLKWVEPVFGHDRLTRVHHSNALLVVALLITHPILVTAGHAMQDHVSLWAQVREFLRHWDDVPLALAGWLTLMTAVALSVALVRQHLRYERWHSTHLLLYAAIGLALLHQFRVGADLTAHRVFATWWVGLYVFAGTNLLLFRFGGPLRNYARWRFRVDHLERETADVESVYISGRDLSRFPIRAGQFMIVRFLAKGFWREGHPFSLSCLPNGRWLRLSIKNVGDFTAKIPLLQAGTPVVVSGPYGVFTARQCHQQKVLMIAAGIGITPIRSLAEDLLKSGHLITLLYGNRTRDGIVFREELEALQTTTDALRVVHVLSHDPTWPGEIGRIDAEKIQRLAPDARDREIYLCGPPPMMTATAAALRALGVPRHQIHYERFSLGTP